MGTTTKNSGYATALINGMELYLSDYVPKKPRFTLSEKVTVTQEFRDSFNEWARGFFGEDEQMIVAGNKIYASPKQYALLKWKLGQ